MARNAEGTKKRILAAATEEFTEHGIAGARVDRIAAAANSNKAMLYAYFGNKEQLFEAVFAQMVTAATDAVPFDARDLPAYAVAMFERYRTDPPVARLSDWYRLEHGKPGPHDAVSAAQRGMVAAIAKAQRDKVISDRLKPQELLSTRCPPTRSRACSQHLSAKPASTSRRPPNPPAPAARPAPPWIASSAACVPLAAGEPGHPVRRFPTRKIPSTAPAGHARSSASWPARFPLSRRLLPARQSARPPRPPRPGGLRRGRDSVRVMNQRQHPGAPRVRLFAAISLSVISVAGSVLLVVTDGIGGNVRWAHHSGASAAPLLLVAGAITAVSIAHPPNGRHGLMRLVAIPATLPTRSPAKTDRTALMHNLQSAPPGPAAPSCCPTWSAPCACTARAP